MKLYKIIGIATLLLFSNLAHAQCTDKVSRPQLEPGMFVWGTMKGEVKTYVAQIITAGKTDFICEFLHSRSAYSFDNLTVLASNKKNMQALVESNVGGKYKKGTAFDLVAFIPYPEGCNFKMKEDFGPETCISTFTGGKSFLGLLSRKNGVLSVNYLHSNSTYTFNEDWTVKTVKNGTYKVGDKVSTVYAAMVELNN
ncbi:MAG: hypothetical protein H7Y86_00305 [Rhizobacter sp.]|nr:hypothetical protein [Ferruginibacter sp.]